ncbi:MAG: ribonucleoside-triphosphate reductase, adenosylcobalamin-dependent, partial [Spirochaetia bacterium]|nr:ribonucleoside-triphosphate reductase, adenosylcobalamin-dependent [Spirochaetia bacterium]
MINVIKRSGQICNFDEEKIVIAVESSMRDSIEGIDSNLSKQIAENIKNKAHDYITVEEIQNLVEDELMQSKRKDVARSYIIYRQMRNINRDLEKEDNKNKILSDEFLSKYKHLPNPMNQLGSFVYYRTYSRWLNVENRRENWWETVRRAVEYNCSLAPTSKEEAEEIFDNIFNLRQFVSGRTFWIGGTTVSEKFACGNFNCAGELIDNIKAFEDLFYLLMIGSGVGIRLLKEDVEKLPYFKVDFNLINEAYHPIEKRKRTDNTSLIFDSDSKSVAKIIIGDSKEGWVKSLGYFLSLLTDHSFRDIKTIIINYDNVRPKGEKLKTFGGTASGYESIMIMFNKIAKLLKKYNHDKEKVKLKPIDCLDICTMIGENVVVGGVRRTAMIALIDSDDEECIKAKNNLYINNNGNWIINKDIINRQMANNTIVYKQKPSREKLHWQIEQNRYSGEPGFFNIEAAQKRNPNTKALNPC